VVFRDPNDDTRAVMSMSWHPDKCRKLAVAYGSAVFQALSPCKNSYVWDMGKETLSTTDTADWKVSPDGSVWGSTLVKFLAFLCVGKFSFFWHFCELFKVLK